MFLKLKKAVPLIIVNITILMLVSCDIAEEDTHWIINNFDKNWEFRLDSLSDSGTSDGSRLDWKGVNLPHDWSILGAFSKDHPTGAREAFLPAGTGWYRKSFQIPEKFRASVVNIRFDGIYMNSSVWINGHLLGNRPNGYVEISYDLTPYLKYGEQSNLIEVKVDNSAQPNSRWYTGSGIYRHVWLEFKGRIHFDKWGIQITTKEILGNKAVISVRTGVKNEELNPDNLTLQTIVTDPDGELIIDKTFEFKISPDTIEYQAQELEIPEPELWSPDHPKVYFVKNILKKGKIILDSHTTLIGIRKFKFDPEKGFSLNEIPMKIKGVCLHSAAGAVGAAVPEGILEYRLKKLKDLGCNAIRFSHNPASPEVLNMCDTLGFMVMTEAFDEWKMPKKWGPDYGYHIYFDQWHKQDLSEMIRRDFNHPSIIMYSIGNEIPEQRQAIPEGAEIAKELVEICHLEDPTRPVTSACDQIPNANKTGFAQALDIVGYNYQDKYYHEDHKKYPDRIILGSETHQFPQTWKKVKDNEYVAGEFLWVGFDYLGEADQFPLKGWENGMFDLTGNIKPRGLLRRTLWNEEPQVYIFSQDPSWKKDTSVFAPWSWEELYDHWNWPEFTGKKINVKCYTNCDEVELFLNRRSLGVKVLSDIGELPLKWTLNYSDGDLKAVARIDGKVVASDELKTAGKAEKLLIESSKDQIRNNEADVSVIQVKVTDKNGITVPDARHLIRFKLEGNAEIIAVDNGDLRSNESFQGNKRSAFKGKAVCIVRATGPGKIRVTASSDGLEPVSIFINAKQE